MDKLIGTATYVGNYRKLKRAFPNLSYNLYRNDDGLTYVETEQGELIQINDNRLDWFFSVNPLYDPIVDVNELITKSKRLSDTMEKIDQHSLKWKLYDVTTKLEEVLEELNKLKITNKS